MTIHPTLLSIAGSDPSGGAGIQADLKTMTAIGVYGAAAITCLTVQNSKGVTDIHVLPPDFVRAQIMAVLEDNNVKHIKIGMLGNINIIRELSNILQIFKGTVVYDPVLASTTGQSLLSGDGSSILKKYLLPWVSYLTPNKVELEVFSGQKIHTAKDAIICAEDMLKVHQNLKAIVVKGGHIGEGNEISDYLLLQNGKTDRSKRKRHPTSNLHGTGCTYASAFASFLALGNKPQTAFAKSGEFMDTVIGRGIGSQLVHDNCNGPLLHHLWRDH